MDPWSFLSSSLLPPGRGDHVAFRVTADLGPDLPIGTLARYLAALQAAFDLGERWGAVLAAAAAEQAFVREASERGPDAIREALGEWPELDRLIEPSESWWFALGPPAYPSPRASWRFAPIVRQLASSNVALLLGEPLVVRGVEYRNPLAADLVGSGFVLSGCIAVLTMVRNWSSKKRAAEAVASAAEAEARKAHALADIAEHLRDEARTGRLTVPISDLLPLVTPTDLAALDHLASTEFRVQLPGSGDA